MDTLDLSALGADGREVVANAATSLHGQRSLLEAGEDAFHAVVDRAHDEAVEQGNVTGGTRASHDAASGDKLEALKDAVELTVVVLAILGGFCFGERLCQVFPFEDSIW